MDMQKAKKCYLAVLAGGLLFCLPASPATHHPPLLMATPSKGKEKIKKESPQEAREVESKETSRSHVLINFIDAINGVVTETNTLLCI